MTARQQFLLKISRKLIGIPDRIHNIADMFRVSQKMYIGHLLPHLFVKVLFRCIPYRTDYSIRCYYLIALRRSDGTSLCRFAGDTASGQDFHAVVNKKISEHITVSGAKRAAYT